MSQKFVSMLVAAGFFVTAALGSTAALAQATAAQPAAPATVAASAPTAPADTVYEYRLGSGDKIKVTVFGEPDLTGEFAVSGEGKVSLPLIGEINAAGATATELQNRIADKLREGYLNDPKVNVEIMTFRPFYIMGEVVRPGQYDFSNGMTIERAVATASGYTYRADKKKVFIKHANQDKEEQVPLDKPVMIAPGDSIRVPERYF